MIPQDVIAHLRDNSGFVGATLRPTVVDLQRETALLRLDAGPELQQHFGGPHAAAIFGLGETAAFAVLLQVFGDLLTDGDVGAGQVAPLVKRSQISFSGIATGPLLAAATLTSPEDEARTAFAERGSLGFDIEVVFRRESDDAETARATYRMGIKRF